MWRRSGIRAVHVAAWHFYNKYVYDYAAWSRWRTKTAFWSTRGSNGRSEQNVLGEAPAVARKDATLAEAQVDWRSPMNLQDPACLKAVLSDLRLFLSRAIGMGWTSAN